MRQLTITRIRKSVFGFGIVTIIAACVFSIAYMARAISASDFSVVDATVNLDGSSDGVATISFKASNGGTLYVLDCTWDTTVEEKLTLTEINPAASITTAAAPITNNIETGQFSWIDMTVNGAVVSDGSILTANYSVDKDTPAGEYNVKLHVDSVAFGESPDDSVTSFDLTGKVTVTHGSSGDKENLIISGIEEQDVTYTGSPVVLAGTLTVSDNQCGVAVSDLLTTWYADDGTTTIAQPINVGTYKVRYSYSSSECQGQLVVGFDIVQASSGQPSEVTANLTAASGEKLSMVKLTNVGLAWKEPDTIVQAGQHSYPAIYTRNGDTVNYLTEEVEIPVYGTSISDIEYEVTISGINVSLSPTGTVKVRKGADLSIKITESLGYRLSAVTVNGSDMKSSVVNNTLTLTNIMQDMEVSVVAEPIKYKFTDGAGQEYDGSSDADMMFKIDAKYVLFERGGVVYLNEEILDKEWYEAKDDDDGYTVLALKVELLDKLSDGVYDLKVIFSDGGTATTNFTVKGVDVPDTGSSTAIADSSTTTGSVVPVVVLVVVAVYVVILLGFTHKVDFTKRK